MKKNLITILVLLLASCSMSSKMNLEIDHLKKINYTLGKNVTLNEKGLFVDDNDTPITGQIIADKESFMVTYNGYENGIFKSSQTELIDKDLLARYAENNKVLYTIEVNAFRNDADKTVVDKNNQPITGNVFVTQSDAVQKIVLFDVVEGNRDGAVREYINLKLYSEQHFKNNKLNGVSKFFDNDGNVSKQFGYKDGALDGLTKLYDTTFIPTVYKNGTKTILINHRNTGKLLKETMYKNGIKDGTEKYYLKNSTAMAIKIPYQNGEVVYPIVGYYPNGAKKFVLTNLEQMDGYCLDKSGDKIRDFDKREKSLTLYSLKDKACFGTP